MDIHSFLSSLAESVGKSSDDFSLDLTEEDIPGTEEANQKIFFRIQASNNLENLKKIPKLYWNAELAQEFVNYSPVLISQLPPEYFSEELIAFAAMRDHRVFRNDKVPFPFKYRTEKVALASLMARSHGAQTHAARVLRHFPYKIKTSEFYEKAVEVFPKVLRHVPPKLQTWRMVVQGLAESNEDAKALRNVNPKYRVKELREAITIAKQDPLFIDWETIDSLSPDVQKEPQ